MPDERQHLQHSAALTILDNATELDAIYPPLADLDLTPGWVNRKEPILIAEPKGAFSPYRWRYSEAKTGLDAAGRLIGTDLAERRNLIMRNPVEGNNFATTRTLVSAYQMIKPGEKARSHRHSSHALRVIIDAKGSFSTVDGEKTLMESGDVVLTPGWCWHGHGHDGDAPAYWFDGLDVPLTQLLEPMFFEEHPDGFQDVETLTQDSPMRFTWSSIQARTEKAAKDGEGFFGRRVRLEAPTMPTIGIFVERLEAGQKTRRYRAAANHIFVPMQGRGVSRVGAETFDWARGDTIAAPMWSWIEHEVHEDTILFTMTDEFLMRFSNYYRFEGAE
ncbi:MAG: cupin domain-containing protein [Beijerinckiaceae bacterium]